MNPVAERYCHSCGHEAHVARLDCQCPRCSTARRRAAAADSPTPLGGAIVEALAALRRGSTSNHSEESAMTRKRNTENVPDPTLVTREVKRTPVTADLAEKIRAFDEAMLATFGFDVCYVVMARDGIVAASNSRDGYLPPIVAPAAPEGGN
jgi:hypothetical protein